ncbi:hypothetical protein AX16_004268 [Volvariella volvacea WC 439]|nr:hypothetical protein AX16_004268 [Volvariella volvacea WC 439]
MPPSQATKKSQQSKKPTGTKSQTRPPKQPVPVAEKLKRLFTSLCAQIEGGHFSNALKTCDKILRLEPNDIDAQKTKLFLLLQTEDYDGALSLIKLQTESPSTQSQPQPSPKYAFSKAYSLYRLHHETEAKEILADIKAVDGVDDRGVVHLEAQMCYRFGEFKEALDLYNDLLDTANPHTEEHSDILTNLEATQRYLDFIEHGFLSSLNSLPQTLSNTIESIPPPTAIVPSTATALSTPAAHITSQTQAQTQSQQPKKPRKSRIPPGVIPGVTPPPDPERWLKKSERTSYNASHQGKRRKGHGGGGGATQGSAVGFAGVNIDAASGAVSSAGSAPSGAGGKSKGKKRR